MGLSLGMKVDAQGRLVAPAPPAPGSLPEILPEIGDDEYGEPSDQPAE
jgi:hypothetical protein